MDLPPHPLHRAGRCPYRPGLAECPQSVAAGASGEDSGMDEAAKGELFGKVFSTVCSAYRQLNMVLLPWSF